MATLDDMIGKALERGTKQKQRELLRHLAFLRRLNKDVREGGDNLNDIAGSAVAALRDHYNAACAIALDYDEERKTFGLENHNGRINEGFDHVVREAMIETYLLQTPFFPRQFTDGNMRESILVPITDNHRYNAVRQKPKAEHPPAGFGGDGRYGVLQVTRDVSFETELDMLVMNDAALTLARAIDAHYQQRQTRIFQQRADYDGLTNAYVRRRFLEVLDAEKKKTSRYGDALSLVMFDIDHFKKINDTYGHKQGDETLKEFAQRIKGAVRDVDSVGRLGGEEFGIIMPRTNYEQAKELAERVRQTVEATPFARVDGNEPLRVTTSGGVCQYSDDAPDVYNIADKQLYIAKNNGRNRVC